MKTVIRLCCRGPKNYSYTGVCVCVCSLLHPYNGLFSRTTWVSRYQKGKASLDLNEAKDDVVSECYGIIWTTYKQSAPRSRQITTPAPHHSIFYRPDALSDVQPTVSKHWRQQQTSTKTHTHVGSTECRLQRKKHQLINERLTTLSLHCGKKVTRTRLPSIRFRSWSRIFAVSLLVMWVINPPVGCHYFPPGPQLPRQPLRGLLPISLVGEQRHDGCEQFA